MPAIDDLTLLVEAARASGTIAKRFFKAAPEVWDKDDNAGPVTEADLAIDEMLRCELTAARPDYGWLSEETEDNPERLSREKVFIVDPIDGTRAFIAGESNFSHSLAIAQNGRITAAAVYLPIKDKLYAATADGPSTLNGEPIRASSAPVEGARMLAARSNLDPEHWKGSVPPVVRHFRPSLAYRLCLVADGKFDAMLTLRDCWEWDIAAGDLIVRQAGGQVTDRFDDALMFNSPGAKTKGCHAAGQALHAELQSRLTV
ncbi:MAG: 3'(2'),5'-bisphosphate nucleotidase CysQ [Paracoccaceae bacterium]